MQKVFTLTMVFVLLEYGLSILLFACHPKISSVNANNTSPVVKEDLPHPKKAKNMTLGAWRLSDYVSELKGKKVGLVVNHTSLVGKSHLVDTLLSLGIDVEKVFAPEHGFRGDADAGEHVLDSKDKKTGLPIISLYGSNKKPYPNQLEGLDVVVFDIQDVGARFYTYISTMHYVMEACAENHKKVVVLDRPNPNGAYIDGPVREARFQSFVGMHPIPIVHGLTVGELALMINGEKWLKDGLQCDLTVVLNQHYTHDSTYCLPVKPSPNLPNDLSVRLYPSLCLFEGTQISVGRGTQFPFQVLGAPQKDLGKFAFVPQSIEGMSKTPKYLGQACYGIDLRSKSLRPHFTLKYLIDFYQKYENKSAFFNTYFDTLAGTDKLRRQIQVGMKEPDIRASWQADLDTYQKTRSKYLMYP
jgi:uncharacterized protein YbbC (DUF1343 family)